MCPVSGYANPPVLITTVRGFLCRFVEVTAAAVSPGWIYYILNNRNILGFYFREATI